MLCENQQFLFPKIIGSLPLCQRAPFLVFLCLIRFFVRWIWDLLSGVSLAREISM